MSFLTVALAFILAYGAVPETAKKRPTVIVETVRTTTLSDVLTYPARIVPKINAVVLSESEGVIQRILAPLGTRVEEGQRLLMMKNTDPVYTYAAVPLTAPVTGVVSAVDVTVGSRVARSQRLMQITDPSQIRITVEVAVSDLQTLRSGLLGELTLPGSEVRYPVQVAGVSPYVDAATGTATAELKQVGAKSQLPPGVVGKVTLKARARNGIQVPEYAVSYRGREPFVRVVVDNTAKFVPVTLGTTHLGMVEVLKGLDSNTTLVMRSSGYVADGEEIQIETKKADGQSG
ncbi:MAG: HlyD family efflux transporter periplasmic adaptor subunit [Deltaproteobacteria bacterium]|nr:HlyD family efflux transporter periplasmic adaptor subunit [Deltaproteobacteria bacterium]